MAPPFTLRPFILGWVAYTAGYTSIFHYYRTDLHRQLITVGFLRTSSDSAYWLITAGSRLEPVVI